MTPELIKAAEEITGNLVPTTSLRFVNTARRLAKAILAHRSDFDAAGLPILVDEAFCKEMGAGEYEQPDDLVCLYWEDDRGWLLSNGVFGQWYIYGKELPEAAWPRHRHELRQLLAVLGGGV